MPMHRLLVAFAATLSVSLAACAGDDNASTDDASADSEARTVEVDMVDIAFEPDTIEVDRGETVRFRFTNRGRVTHDAFIGDSDAQADHGTEMREGDDEGHGNGDGHGDDAGDAVTVEPGDTGEITYTFHEDETLEIGCHQPGHYDTGMKITVEIA